MKLYVVFKRTFVFSFVFIALVPPSCSAMFDLTPSYRSTLFQGFPQADQRDWSSRFEFQYSAGNGHHALDKNENITSLFNAQGFFELADLGTNLEGLTQATKPLTWLYLRDLEGDAGLMTALGEDSTTGQFQFGGKLFTHQMDFLFQQNIFSGFYIQAYVPVRKVRLRDIEFVHRGEQPEGQDKIDFDNFLQDFDEILAENDLRPLATDYRQDAVSDFVVSIGWQGYDNVSFGIIDAVHGYLQIGLLIPVGRRQDLMQVFSLPLGNDRLWGIHSRFVLQANAFEFVAFGLQGGITTFFDRTQDLRLKTSLDQNGWINLQRARAQVDRGAIWDIGGFIKMDHVKGGFSFLGGYTFTKGERTCLTVKDDNYLKTFVKTEKDKDPPVIVSRDEIANSDQRLGVWFQHVVHALVQYDLGVHLRSSIAPQIELSYHFPFYGKFIMQTDMISGRFGLSLHWDIG